MLTLLRSLVNEIFDTKVYKIETLVLLHPSGESALISQGTRGNAGKTNNPVLVLETESGVMSYEIISFMDENNYHKNERSTR